MPLYEYVCAKCHHGFEALVTASRAAQCPQCASEDLEQQFSGFAVGSVKGKGQFSKSAGTGAKPCGSCGHPDGPGSCSN